MFKFYYDPNEDFDRITDSLNHCKRARLILNRLNQLETENKIYRKQLEQKDKEIQKLKNLLNEKNQMLLNLNANINNSEIDHLKSIIERLYKDNVKLESQVENVLSDIIEISKAFKDTSRFDKDFREEVIKTIRPKQTKENLTVIKII